MAFVLVIMIGLNMVQLNKDAARCKKANYEAKGCSVFLKAGVKKDK
jgi:hypothetical protein